MSAKKGKEVEVLHLDALEHHVQVVASVTRAKVRNRTVVVAIGPVTTTNVVAAGTAEKKYEEILTLIRNHSTTRTTKTSAKVHHPTQILFHSILTVRTLILLFTMISHRGCSRIEDRTSERHATKRADVAEIVTPIKAVTNARIGITPQEEGPAKDNREIINAHTAEITEPHKDIEDLNMTTEGTDKFKGIDQNRGTEILKGTDHNKGTDKFKGTDHNKGTEIFKGTEIIEGTDQIEGTELHKRDATEIDLRDTTLEEDQHIREDQLMSATLIQTTHALLAPVIARRRIVPS